MTALYWFLFGFLCCHAAPLLNPAIYFSEEYVLGCTLALEGMVQRQCVTTEKRAALTEIIFSDAANFNNQTTAPNCDVTAPLWTKGSSCSTTRFSATGVQLSAQGCTTLNVQFINFIIGCQDQGRVAFLSGMIALAVIGGILVIFGVAVWISK